MAGVATIAPSASMVPLRVLIVCSINAGVMRGRAPSCMATNSNSSGVASKPLNALSWRESPAGASAMGVTKGYGSIARVRYSSMRSFGQTTTMSPMSSTKSNAESDQDSIGWPSMPTICLPPSAPNRWPEPPARMMAATLAFLPTLPYPENARENDHSASSAAGSTSICGCCTGSCTPPGKTSDIAICSLPSCPLGEARSHATLHDGRAGRERGRRGVPMIL